MTTSIIYIHEEALRTDHPVFLHAPANSRSIFVWDDDYLKQQNYSLKRLIFIYETLCTMPIELMRGSTQVILSSLQPAKIYTQSTSNPAISLKISMMNAIAPVIIVSDEAFCKTNVGDYQRFSQYWKRAQQSILLKNGG